MISTEKGDDFFMKQAHLEATYALNEKEIPVGAIIVCENKIIARAHNMTQLLNDVTAHAEMQAITAASSYLGGKYLSNCTLYVTLEPCVMCAGAIFWVHLERLVYGASDELNGFTRKGITLHPKTTLTLGVLEKECSALLQLFFKDKRK